MSRLATLDGQDIPTGRAIQATPGCVAEHLVFVPAATVTLTVRPGGFVMSVIEGTRNAVGELQQLLYTA